jgi:RHS repeat-associated protein
VTIHEYSYTYDEHGNIIKTTGKEGGDTGLLTDAVMTYDEDNRLITYNGEQVSYDAEGNMLHGPLNGKMADYEYDCRNRLIRVTEEDGSVTAYEYDAENTRTAVIKDGKKTVYVTDKNTTYSQTLTETVYTQNLTGSYTKKEAEKTYTYGIGLISECQNGEETLFYHYNNLGSTTEVTNKKGSVEYRFAYGSYGELTGIYDGTGESLITYVVGETKAEALCDAVSETGISFLYNGQYGVMTDTNGLYYMRARYYNTDIKRFINRDVVNGSIADSQSLNKYSYVQGNPVTLTDPFGLNPLGNQLNIDWSQIGHTILDVVGIFCDAADLLNAAWYASEGNYQMAMVCGIAAIPLAGSMVSGAAKLFMGAEKATKAVRVISQVTKLATFTATATITAIDTYYAAADAKAAYEAGNLSVGEAATVVGLGAITTAVSIKAGKSAVGLANTLHEMRVVDKAVTSVAEGVTKFHTDNRGCLDTSYFTKNKAKDVMISEGGNPSIFDDVFDAADNYKLSNDTYVEHILDRHGPNSTYTNKSHFNSDFDIKSSIDSTLKGDNFIVRPNTNGRNGYIFEQTFNNAIGTNAKGKPLYTLKVVIDDLGNVITAFPKK